jgi:transcription elongation GreA/GreB family factor
MNIKELLFSKCEQLVAQRMTNAKQAMDAAQESANQEEKSSAGDKYETGRAMAQLERDKAAAQLLEARKMQVVLELVKQRPITAKIGLGSMVVTDFNKFYVSVSAGKLSVADATYLAVSLQSPIGQLMVNKSVGDQFIFNNQKQTIISVL